MVQFDEEKLYSIGGVKCARTASINFQSEWYLSYSHSSIAATATCQPHLKEVLTPCDVFRVICLFLSFHFVS